MSHLNFHGGGVTVTGLTVTGLTVTGLDDGVSNSESVAERDVSSCSHEGLSLK